jgi:predicted nucleic acid-binding protein
MLDADALLCLRKLSAGSQSLLELIAAFFRDRADPIMLTEFIARHELNSIALEISSYESSAAIRVQGLEARDPMYRELRKSVHKGEAEAIAWIYSKTVDLRPVFVSRDTKAIRMARSYGLAATDVFGLIVEAVISNVILESHARDALDVWEDPSQELCRPADYRHFDESFPRRKGSAGLLLNGLLIPARSLLVRPPS